MSHVSFLETLKLAFSAIWVHKLRSALTLVGMVIGVAAVALMVSVIGGFNTYVDEKIAGIGSQSFTVQRFSMEDYKDTDTIAAAQRTNKELTLEDYAYLLTRATLVNEIGAKSMPTNAEVKSAAVVLAEVPVTGTTANLSTIDDVNISEGRYFTAGENEAAMRVAFIGADLVTKLFQDDSPVDQKITIAGLPYRVIGVAAAKGIVFGVPLDTFVTIPLKTHERYYGTLSLQRSLIFVATSRNEGTFDDAVDEVRFLLRLRRHLSSEQKDNFGIVTPDAITGMRDRIFRPISIVAIAVPSIALLIGGIVIMNIMLVSVTERTAEIGIRKALGARRVDVLKQFLIEAVVLSGIGGMFGILLTAIAGHLITVMFFPTPFSLTALILAISASSVVGVLSGILPAWKAARINPVEALRAE